MKLEQIENNKHDYKVCKKCDSINYHTLNRCHNCNFIYFDSTMQILDKVIKSYYKSPSKHIKVKVI